jgi:hypothetical protein
MANDRSPNTVIQQSPKTADFPSLNSVSSRALDTAGYRALDSAESEEDLLNTMDKEAEENPSETGSIEEEEEEISLTSSSGQDSSAAAGDGDSDEDLDDEDDRQPLMAEDKDAFKRSVVVAAATAGESLPRLEEATAHSTAAIGGKKEKAEGDVDLSRLEKSENFQEGVPALQLLTGTPSPARQRAAMLPPLEIRDPTQPATTINHQSEDMFAASSSSAPPAASARASPRAAAYLASPEYAAVTLRRASPITSPARNRSVRSDFISSLVDQQQQQQQQLNSNSSSGGFPLKLEIPSPGPDIGLPPLPKSSPPKFTGEATKIDDYICVLYIENWGLCQGSVINECFLHY